jgi:mitochondrial fission protein ELM1
VTDGKAGMESQCLGLAEALGVSPAVKRVALRPFWRVVTPYVRFGGTRQFARNSDRLIPPWPDLLIATGRHSVAAALYVKRASQDRTRLVQIQNPAISLRHFDLVIAPKHDRLHGENVVSTTGALHRITGSLLTEHASHWLPVFSHLRRPYVVVLIGGSNSAFRFGVAESRALAHKLRQAAAALNGSLLVTPSRRTSPEAIAALSDALRGTSHFVWNMAGENPYFGLLGLADFIIVTCDSVNMVSEAASTGKPVYIEMLPGGSTKSSRFLTSLREAGAMRAFEGKLVPYAYAPIDDRAIAVRRLQQLFAAA